MDEIKKELQHIKWATVVMVLLHVSQNPWLLKLLAIIPPGIGYIGATALVMLYGVALMLRP